MMLFGRLDMSNLTKKINDIKLEETNGYSSIENKLDILYENQEQILQAIKLLNENLRQKAKYGGKE